jgi:hypothetical protein
MNEAARIVIRAARESYTIDIAIRAVCQFHRLHAIRTTVLEAEGVKHRVSGAILGNAEQNARDIRSCARQCRAIQNSVCCFNQKVVLLECREQSLAGRPEIQGVEAGLQTAGGLSGGIDGEGAAIAKRAWIVTLLTAAAEWCAQDYRWDLPRWVHIREITCELRGRRRTLKSRLMACDRISDRIHAT